MKYQELTSLNEAELRSKLAGLREELFKLNQQRYSGTVAKPHQFKLVRRDIARINTILNIKKEKNNG